MQSTMLKHITEDFGNGGTIDGDVIITGDLQVSGGGSLSFDEVIEGTQVIDVTNTEALLVRKNSDGGDVFTVDTTNSEVELGVDVKLKIKDSDYSGQLSINSNGYTELQALGDRSIDLKSQRQIRMFTSDDGASYTEALNLSSTGGNATFLGTLTVGADGSGKDVIFYSATAGDSFAWDASEEKLTITGTNGQTALDVADGNLVVADNVDIEGDIDVNGTTNLDAVDIDGNVQLDGTFTVGTDGSGQDVTFYSATSGDSFAWDASEEKLTITGTDGALALDIADGFVKVQESLSITNGSGSFYVWSDDPFGSNYEVLRIDKPSGSNGRISVYKGGTGTYRGLEFQTGGSARMTIDSAGKVGIGGTPSYALDVHANLEGNVARFYNDGNDGNRDVLLLQGGADSAGFNTRFITFLDGDGGTVGCLQGASGTSNGGLALNITPDTNNLVVDSTGNVGIGGLSDPAYKLEVKSSVTGDWVTRIYNTADSSNPSGLLVRVDDADSTGILFGANASGTYRMVIKPDGNVGIGVSDPDSELEIFHATDPQIKFSINTHGDAGIMLGDADGLKLYGKGASNQLRLYSGASTLQAQIDANGITFNDVVDITDTTDSSDDSGDTGALRVEGGASIAKKLYVGGSVSLENGLDVLATTTLNYATNIMTLTRDGGHLMVLKNSGSAIGDGEALGYYRFTGKVGANDEEVGAEIRAEADGAWTADTDCPTRMVFRQNSGSGTQEVMRIDKTGSLLIGKTTNATSLANAISIQAHNGLSESGQAPAVFSKGNAGHALIGQGQSAGVEDCVYFSNSSTAWGGATKGIVKITDANAGATTSNFFYCEDSGGTEARLDTNGLYYGQGTAVSSIDYAEFFESKDGKAIPFGTTVKLDGDKIVPCADGDTPIGVIRPNEGSSVLGGNPLQWHKKYKRTDYDAYETEDYEVIEWEVTKVIKEAYTDENGDKHEAVTESHFEQCEKGKEPEGVEIPSDAFVVKKTRRIVNPDYDSSKTYIERKDRDEWNLVGLLGQVPITKGQPVASNWIKMRDVSDSVEMYLIK